MNTPAGLRNTAICLCLNDRFVQPARAMLESIRVNGGGMEGLTLVVITDGLTSASMRALEESASSTGLKLSVRTIGDTAEIGGVPDWAVSTCLRLYVGDICHDFERALYLDADMLILSDLQPIIDFDLGGRTAAAVVNHPPLDVMRVAIPRSRRGNADGDAPYFNAGIILIDIERWQRHSIGEKCRSFIRRFPTTRLFDQDALNVALVNDWRALGKEWNIPAGPLDDAPMLRGLAHLNPSLTGALREWKRAQRNPKVLHFTGQPKPWEDRYPWPELKETYRRYALPEFGPVWPSTRPETVSDPGGAQVKIREFRRT